MVRATPAASYAGYGGDLEAEAQEWIEGVTGEAFEGGFEDSLRDGVKLCKLLNTIKPGAVRRVNTKEGQNKFKQMENISNFIRGCREIGVKEYSLFETVDLYEGKDVGLVVKCLVSTTLGYFWDFLPQNPLAGLAGRPALSKSDFGARRGPQRFARTRYCWQRSH